MFDRNRFENREQAGEMLAQHLSAYAGRTDAIVLALPRGGVPVGYVVAKHLQLPLDVFLVRKLGMPGHEEFAMGAISSGGTRFLQEDVVRSYGISERVIDTVAQGELLELERREKLYRAGRPPLELAKRVVILVDDGLATGSTMKAAALAVRKANPAKIIVAVPVGAAESFEKLRSDVDDIICLRTPDPFYAVGTWYVNFTQTSDDDVIRLLDDAAQGTKEREDKVSHYQV
ncbi:MAG: phosphoribosyltransferase [Undibacterium sp.]|nr:phosphoribosyltransferase [Undibacterium sp.]